MCFCEEVICIHAGCEHCSKRSCALVRLDSSSENNEVSLDVELLVGDKVGCLNIECSVSSGSDLADHTLYIMYVIFLNGSAVELIKILTGSTNVDIEYINIGIGIFFTCKHSVLSSVHTADL